MKPTFEKTVDVLVKAYLDDTLAHMSCKACAVGNLMTAAGVDFSTQCSAKWLAYLMVNLRGRSYMDVSESELAIGLSQITATGYTPYEIHLIERAFESEAWEHGDTMFKGLMAVVDVLADIHGIDLEKKEAAKLLFVKV